MKIFKCKCGSKEIFVEEKGCHKGLYCADCGKWIQWLSNDDLRLAKRRIEQLAVNPIHINSDKLGCMKKITIEFNISELDEDTQINGDKIPVDEFAINIAHYVADELAVAGCVCSYDIKEAIECEN